MIVPIFEEVNHPRTFCKLSVSQKSDFCSLEAVEKTLILKNIPIPIRIIIESMGAFRS
ncbi:MAG: hypothetical protein LBH96_00265 [Candidatus Peribacteria bacterium]|nr:hypothetical protein [Candidatus Peribacteria bacterium]